LLRHDTCSHELRQDALHVLRFHIRLRRDPRWLLLGPLFVLSLTACQSRDGYFGRVTKPTARRLVVENQVEPASLDPHFMFNWQDFAIADALFDGLVGLDPETLQPTAAIATHYVRNEDATRYVFYLRGHPQPRGIRLRNTDDLREEFRTGTLKEDLARGHSAPADSVPARWSDGAPVTAHDFVYSWRRLFDPKTASPVAGFSIFILNSEAILAGKRPSQDLGVRALDDWALEVLLARPTDYFLTTLDIWQMFPVPRQAIEAAEARGAPGSWTMPGHIVTDGPFTLAEWRPSESLTVRRNPDYWEADLTGLDEIVFLPIADNLVNINLYRSGEADTLLIPPAYKPPLRNMRDHGEMPQLDVHYIQFNTRQPPLDNVLLRYALNMATDKTEAAKVYNGNQRPARTFGVPALGYQPPGTVPVTIRGRTYDVISYDPPAARELLAKAGFPGGMRQDGQRLRLDLAYASSYPVAEDLVEVLRRQWSDNLGIDLRISKLDAAQYFSALLNGQYQAGYNNYVSLPDPTSYLLAFQLEEALGTFWRPPAFATLLEEALSTVDRTARLKKLVDGDRMITEGMPVIPLIFDSADFMRKPYVRGLPMNVSSMYRFKYAWVETQ
jgi:ABC-type oligopeptide transport system substrate-binding subunit